MTPRQLEILHHALGLDKYGQGSWYRNHFCAGGKDEATCRELVALGYMVQHATTDVFPYFNCSVTTAGKRAVQEESPKPPRESRGAERWARYMNAKDAWPDLTFPQWLKSRGGPA